MPVKSIDPELEKRVKADFNGLWRDFRGDASKVKEAFLQGLEKNEGLAGLSRTEREQIFARFSEIEPKELARETRGPVGGAAVEVFGEAKPMSRTDVELMLLKTRLGHGITANLPEKKPNVNENALHELEALEERQLLAGVHKRLDFEDMRSRRREIIDAMKELSGRDYDYVDFAALMAVRHGTGGRLLEYLNDARKLHDHGIIRMSSIGNIASSVRDGVPERILEVLDSGNSAVSISQLCELIGGARTVRERRRIMQGMDVAINLLDKMGGVMKLPMSGDNSMWISPRMRYSEGTIPVWNLSYNILEILSEHPNIHATEIAGYAAERGAIQDKPHKIAGKGDYRGSTTIIESALDTLYQSGLIKAEVRKAGQMRAYHYSLTPEADDWLSRTMRNGYLNDELRRSLLGVHYSGLMLSQKKMVDKIAAWMDVRDAIREHPDWKDRRIAGELGENYIYVKNVRKGDTPWHRSSRDTLESYIPHLPAEKQDEFGRYLREDFVQKG